MPQQNRRTIAPHSRLVSTQPLVWQDHSLGALGKDQQLSSVLLEQISPQPLASLETILERVACAGRVVFFRQGSTFGHPLVFRNLGLFHDVLALPNTCKWQVPEIAVDKVLKATLLLFGVIFNNEGQISIF